HVLTCSECELMRADFLNLRSQLTSFETSLEPQVQNRALKKILAGPRRAPARGLQWSFGTQALAFATLLIVAAIVGWVAYQNSNQREPKPGEQFAAIPERVRSADSETMTAMHFETSERLLLAFKNVRLDEAGAAEEVGYERKRAKQLVYQNMLLKREADAAGDVQI